MRYCTAYLRAMRCRKNPSLRYQRPATKESIVDVNSNLPRKLPAVCRDAVGNTKEWILNVSFPSEICTDTNSFNSDTDIFSVTYFIVDYGLDRPGIVFRWNEVFRPVKPILGPT